MGLIKVADNIGVFHAKTATYHDPTIGSGHTVHVEVFKSDVVPIPMVTLYTQKQHALRSFALVGNLNDLQRLRDGLTELLKEFGKE